MNVIDVREAQWKEKIAKEEDERQKVQEAEEKRDRARGTVRTVYVPTSLLTRCSPSQTLSSSFYLPFALAPHL